MLNGGSDENALEWVSWEGREKYFPMYLEFERITIDNKIIDFQLMQIQAHWESNKINFNNITSHLWTLKPVQNATPCLKTF